MVRRRRGDGGGHGTAHRTRVDRLVGELAYRAPLGDRFPYRLGGAEPEHVVGGGAHQRAGAVAPTVSVADQMGESAHDGDRQPFRLPLHQVAGGGEFVSGGDDGRAQRIAVGIGATAQIVEHADTRGADGDIGEPVAPRPSEGVGDDDADVHAERLTQSLAERPRRGVGVLGQQQHRAGRGVGGIHPGGGHHQALPVLDDAQRAAPGHHPYRLRVDRGLAVGRGEDPPLGLAHDLGGDQQDVAVREIRRGGGHQGGEVVAGADLRQPGHGPDLEPHARTSSARASA